MIPFLIFMTGAVVGAIVMLVFCFGVDEKLGNANEAAFRQIHDRDTRRYMELVGRNSHLEQQIAELKGISVWEVRGFTVGEDGKPITRDKV